MQLGVVLAVLSIAAATVLPDWVEHSRTRMAEKAALDVVVVQDAAKRYFLASSTDATPLQRRWPGQTGPGNVASSTACLPGSGPQTSQAELLLSGGLTAPGFVNPWGQPYQLQVVAGSGASCALTVSTSLPEKVQGPQVVPKMLVMNSSCVSGVSPPL